MSVECCVGPQIAERSGLQFDRRVRCTNTGTDLAPQITQYPPRRRAIRTGNGGLS